MNDIQLVLNATPTGALVVLGLTILILVVIIVFLAIRLNHSIQQATLNNGRSNQYLAAVPADRIGIVNAVYQNTRKDLASAMILTLVGGLFGFQRAYLGKRKSAMAMFLFFWTGIPSTISLFDLTDMPRLVSEFNLGVVESLYDQIAAPKLEE